MRGSGRMGRRKKEEGPVLPVYFYDKSAAHAPALIRYIFIILIIVMMTAIYIFLRFPKAFLWTSSVSFCTFYNLHPFYQCTPCSFNI